MPTLTTRYDDERHLKWLKLRCGGLKTADIGERFGVPETQVRVACNRIRNADLEESGEPAGRVLAAYKW